MNVAAHGPDIAADQNHPTRTGRLHDGSRLVTAAALSGYSSVFWTAA